METGARSSREATRKEGQGMKVKMYVKKDYLAKLIENTVLALNWWDLETPERPTRAELEKMLLTEFLQTKNFELIVND